MIRRVLTTIFIILTIAAGVYAKDTVLNLVPQDSTGFMYMGNPMRLSQKIDNLASNMTNSQQSNLIAKKLADAFGAGFQSFDELYNDGFDLRKDFCIFFYSATPENDLAVVAHVHDPDGVKNLLQEKVGSMNEKEYAGIKYFLGDKGAFAIFDNLFVMARSEDLCKKIIDTYKKKNDSILKNSNYKSLKLDLSEKNGIAVFVDLDKVVQTYSPKLQEIKKKAESSIEEKANEQQKNSAKMVKFISDFYIGLIEQLDLYCLTADLEGQTAKFTGFVKFKEGSEIQQFTSTGPTKLNLLRLLPTGNFLAGSGVYTKEDWVNLFSMMFDTAQKDVKVNSQAYKEFIKGLEEFYSHFGKKAAFAVDVGSSMVPDELYIFETKDDKSAKEYMKTGYLEYLKLIPNLYKQMGLDPNTMKMLADATPGETETYEGVEIQCINLPNMGKAFADMPEEMKPLVPQNWALWYAIKDGKMISSMSGNSELVKKVIDVMNGKAENIESNESYNKLAHSIASKNNFVAYFSPVMLSKRIGALVSQTNPDAGGMLTMMFNNLPESYNMVISGINRDKGIEFHTIIALDDLKQLIQMIVMISQQK